MIGKERGKVGSPNKRGKMEGTNREDGSTNNRRGRMKTRKHVSTGSKCNFACFPMSFLVPWYVFLLVRNTVWVLQNRFVYLWDVGEVEGRWRRGELVKLHR